MDLVIEKVDLEKIDIWKLNESNEYSIQPLDYTSMKSTTNLDSYIDNFHLVYTVINFSKKEMFWMKSAHEIGIFTGGFPESFNEELNELLEKYKESTKHLFDGNNKFFVRTNSVSLKEGKYGVGPYFTLKQIIESMISSSKSHSALANKIYLLPWVELERDLEFRCFVYKNRITAISQQFLYNDNDTLCGYSSEKIRELVENLINYFKQNVLYKIGTDSFVMDIGHLAESKKAFFIEANPWGKEYGSGSSLFQWTKDYNDLYNDRDDTVIFKYR